jgi:uncharacterized protein (TIGR02271 family)
MMPMKPRKNDPEQAIARKKSAKILPVVEEQVHVEKQQVEHGKVRITKTVQEREQVIDEPLMHEDVEVERVRVDKEIDAPASPRREGEVWIVPLMEEVVVVERRLMLREELHIRKRQTQVSRPKSVTLRTEQAHIERDNSA